MESETQAQLNTRRIVKKITAKVVCGRISIEKLIDFNKVHGKDAVMPLFDVVGMASDSVAGMTDTGPYVKLLGLFRAVNVETGERFRSGAVILPGGANDMVYGALKGLGEAGGSVEFSFKIGIQRDESSATGYVYVVGQVYQQGQGDALDALEARLSPPANVAQLGDKTGTGGRKK
jgi:hypothetical protein